MIPRPDLVPIVVCVDVEPVARRTDPRRPEAWDGFGQVHELYSRLRHILPGEDGPARYSWFFRLDPQVAETHGDSAWPLREYARIVDSIGRAGDELGVHPHAWRWTGTQWLADHGNQEWVDHCVRMSFQTLENTLGIRCRICRMGDRWSSTATTRLLESLGAEIDMTPEPGKQGCAGLGSAEAATGALPDYSPTPQGPYTPSQEDFRVPGKDNRGLVVLPLTTCRIPSPLRVACRSYHDVQTLRGVAVYSDYACSSMRVGLSLPPSLFRHLVNSHIASSSRPYLAFAIRSNEGCHSVLRRWMETNLLWLSMGRRSWRAVFVTPHEALRMFGAGGVARSRFRDFPP